MIRSPNMFGMSRAKGGLSVRRIQAPLQRPVIRSIDDAVRFGVPGRVSFFDRAAAKRREWQRSNEENFARSLADQGLRDAGVLHFIGHLWLTKVGRDGSFLDLGLVSCRVV